jgi:hypothetical protein
MKSLLVTYRWDDTDICMSEMHGNIYLAIYIIDIGATKKQIPLTAGSCASDLLS